MELHHQEWIHAHTEREEIANRCWVQNVTFSHFGVRVLLLPETWWQSDDRKALRSENKVGNVFAHLAKKHLSLCTTTKQTGIKGGRNSQESFVSRLTENKFKYGSTHSYVQIFISQTLVFLKQIVHFLYVGDSEEWEGKTSIYSTVCSLVKAMFS